MVLRVRRSGIDKGCPHALPPGAVNPVGIRIAEGVPPTILPMMASTSSSSASAPLPARGAISSNTPPLALGQPTDAPLEVSFRTYSDVGESGAPELCTHG